MDPIYLTNNEPSAPYDRIEIDEDDEEDELDSDLEEHEAPPPVKKVLDGEEIEPDPEDDDQDLVGPGQSSSANGRRKHLRKSGERVPGYSLLPQTRIENILRADGEAGPMSKEAQFALSVATEEFIKRLAHAGYQLANAQKRSIVSYRDMAAIASQNPSMTFLQDIIPSPMSLTVALDRRALKEKELIDEDPALTVPAAPSPLPSLSRLTLSVPSASTQPTPTPTDVDSPSAGPAPKRSRSKRTANGKDIDMDKVLDAAPAPVAKPKPPKEKGKARASTALPNGTHDATERRQSARTRDRHGRFSHGGEEGGASHSRRRSSRRSEPEPPQGWTEVAVDGAPHSPLALHGVHKNGVVSQPLSPNRDPARADDSRRTHSQPPVWPGPGPSLLAGPASGYLDDRARSGSAGASSDTPFGSTGRTIYSQR